MKIALLGILLFSCTSASATQQIKDRVHFEGLDFVINELPLEKLPGIKSEIIKDNIARCSANWRGYQAGWYIQNSQLSLSYLIKNPCSKVKEYYDLSKYFNNESSLVNANWYTGSITIRISEKEIIQEKAFSRYQAVLYKIKEGKVVSREVKFIEEKF